MKNLSVLVSVFIIFTSCMTSNKTSTKPVEIQLVRNATLKFDYNGKTFLVDPSLSPKNSFMSFVVPDKNLNPTVDLPIPISEITEGLDVILVTHTHLDHFDEGAIKFLDPDLPLFGQPFDKEKLDQSPFNNVSVIIDKQEYEGTTITRTTGKHGPDHLLESLGEVSGFVLQAEDYPTIYIVGDCLLDEDIKNAIKRYTPDIIVINSGGAEWGGEKILMDEKRAIELTKLVPNSKVVAVHMESLDHCKTTRQMIRDEAQKEKVDILVPNDGETLKL